MAADLTIQAIQSINASIGLNAPLDLPASVSAAMLPLALTFIGPMTGGKFPQTTYVTLVFIAGVSAGINPQPIFDSGNAFLKAMRAAYRPLGTINGYPVEHGLHPTANGGTGSPYGMLHLIKYQGTESYGYSWHVTLLESP